MVYFFKRYAGLLYLVSTFASVRDIFDYDHTWSYVDYEIVATGSIYKTESTITLLCFNDDYKLIAKK